VEVKRVVGGRKQRLLSRWPCWPCSGEHAGEAKETTTPLLRKKKFEAVSVYVAYWAELIDWSVGLCRLGGGQVSFFSFFFCSVSYFIFLYFFVCYVSYLNFILFAGFSN
jgi:hypothetical protein